MASRLGHSLSITSFGESHGPMVGVVLDGFPGGETIDMQAIRKDLERRKPGVSDISTSRKEDDTFEIVSGVFEGRSTGSPITILIPNTNQNPSDYEALKSIYRPGHADRVYEQKYSMRDHRGGGRASARVTAAWVAAGSIAKTYLLEKYQIRIQAVVSSVGNIIVNKVYESDWTKAENNVVKCPDAEVAKAMEDLIKQTALEGDSLGGCISCRIQNCPPGLGEPLFDKLNADLAKAVFSINAVKGLEFGSGFAGSKSKGSENNDTAGSSRNNDGGISGGISNGKDILFTVAFKPVSSIKIEQAAYTSDNEIKQIQIEGRHDPCVVPRAVPIVEAVSAITLLDHLFLHLKYKK